MRNIRKGSASYKLLLILEKAIDGYVRVDDFINNPGLYLYSSDGYLKKSTLSQAINRLREGGVIEKVKLNNEIILKLTESGKDLIVRDQEEIWDGKWRIVSFDIPEEKRVLRNLFRRNLKKWGFNYLHKSVWFSKRNVYEKLILYIKDLGIEKWVTVIEANRISI